MRFNIATLVLASGFASATGTAHVANNTYIQTLQQQNLDIVRQLPQMCSLAACLNLTAQIMCIANAIINGDPAALQKCLTTSMSQICSCVACVPAVENVLAALGICPVSNDDDDDEPSSG
ncbi:uncharacterized protein N7518_005172 [Penicillium psychrosexuale]|uniref:uncharacterized protein n=1 Tax=Penicillium psychrosexuale TaxID=1002107 RepID=UPI0025452755|nr:uncharacterized protein N7518_005172 [Penicillium psychrosexuale]KAJ5796632.1 hypothetical protein N7518_005172 [Penicillium psychrosexuale]